MKLILILLMTAILSSCASTDPSLNKSTKDGLSEKGATTLNTAYLVWGQHGGYGLCGQKRSSESIHNLYDLANSDPRIMYSMDYEAYSLDRMANGAKLDMEKEVEHAEFKDNESLALFRKLVDEGRMTFVSSYTQPLMYYCDGESLVRQIGEARRAVRETMGIEFETYWTQEPCWAGQLPALLSGFDFKGVYFANTWCTFGTAPIHDAEKVMWEGPDGSQIPTLPRTTHGTIPDSFPEYGKEAMGYWTMSSIPQKKQLKQAEEAGMSHAIVENCGKDFMPHNVKTPYEAKRNRDNIEIVCTKLPDAIEMARNDGVWHDAYAEFVPQFCWGLNGGHQLYNSRRGGVVAVQAAAIAAISGKDLRSEIDLIWEAAMLAQHHDMQVLLHGDSGKHSQFNVPFHLIPRDARLEAETRMARLFANPAATSFSVVNTTQKDRREWIPVQLELPTGQLQADEAMVADSVSRLTVESKHSDGSARQIMGRFLAEVPAFSARSWNIAAGEDNSDLPVTGEVKDSNAIIDNGQLRLVANSRSIALYRKDELVVKDIVLKGNINGEQEIGSTAGFGALVTPDGVAIAFIEGNIADIPYSIQLSLAPWSEQLEVNIECTLDGQRIEGRRFDDLDGQLKLVLVHDRLVDTYCHQAFELRKPTRRFSHAVHYAMTEWHGTGGGFVTVLDRPSGIVVNERDIGVALLHSGSYPYGRGGKDGNQDLVSGTVSYALSVVPFNRDQKRKAAWEYQRSTRPLTLVPPIETALNLSIDGHSLVSGIEPCDEEGAVAMRLWNPLHNEVLTITAPGKTIYSTNLEGRHEKKLGKDKAELTMRSMQVQQIVLR